MRDEFVGVGESFLNSIAVPSFIPSLITSFLRAYSVQCNTKNI